MRRDLVILGAWLMVTFGDGWDAYPLWQRVLIGIGFFTIFMWPQIAGTNGQRENSGKPAPKNG